MIARLEFPHMSCGAVCLKRFISCCEDCEWWGLWIDESLKRA